MGRGEEDTPGREILTSVLPSNERRNNLRRLENLTRLEQLPLPFARNSAGSTLLQRTLSELRNDPPRFLVLLQGNTWVEQIRALEGAEQALATIGDTLFTYRKFTALYDLEQTTQEVPYRKEAVAVAFHLRTRDVPEAEVRHTENAWQERAVLLAANIRRGEWPGKRTMQGEQQVVTGHGRFLVVRGVPNSERTYFEQVANVAAVVRRLRRMYEHHGSALGAVYDLAGAQPYYVQTVVRLQHTDDVGQYTLRNYTDPRHKNGVPRVDAEA